VWKGVWFSSGNRIRGSRLVEGEGNGYEQKQGDQEHTANQYAK